MKTLIALAACAALAVAAPTIKVEAFGVNGARVRVAPDGAPIRDPVYQALQMPPPPSPPSRAWAAGDADSLINGNLRVSWTPEGLITAVRVSDKTTLLTQTKAEFGAPALGSHRDSVSALASFAIQSADSERLYGFGEHRTGTVRMQEYFKLFQVTKTNVLICVALLNFLLHRTHNTTTCRRVVM